MAVYTFVVTSRPGEGKDTEYNDWYTKQHLPDVLRIPGLVAARRFKLAGTQVQPTESAQPYLALYEVETDDIQGTIDELVKRSGTADMPISAAMAGADMVVYEAFTPRVTAT